VTPLGCDCQKGKKVIARKVRETVIWFNARKE
jgi:hypothetical protein